MPNYRFDLVQGSEEWLEARLGIPTASEFSNIVQPEFGNNYHCPACGQDDNHSRKKCAACGALVEVVPIAKLSASYQPYLNLKLAEWMAGVPLDIFEDQPPIRGWRERGTLLEPEARRYYEMERDVETQKVGLVATEDGMAACSPDFLAGNDIGGELKCPGLATHVGYMRNPASLLAEYRMQVQGGLWICADRGAWDVMSYYPGFPAVIIRAEREQKVQDALSIHIPAFVDAMLAARARLTETYGELRRERVSAGQRVEASRAAFDEFVNSPIGGVV